MGAEEIKIPFDCDACAGNELERLETGKTHLHAGAIFAVLDDGVVQLQFAFGRYDIISAKAGVVKLAGDPEIPIVIRLIDQRWFREDPLKAQLIGD